MTICTEFSYHAKCLSSHTFHRQSIVGNLWSWRWSIFHQTNFICRSNTLPDCCSHFLLLLFCIHSVLFSLPKVSMWGTFGKMRPTCKHARNQHSVACRLDLRASKNFPEQITTFDGSWLELIYRLIQLDLMPTSLVTSIKITIKHSLTVQSPLFCGILRDTQKICRINMQRHMPKRNDKK